MLAAADHIARPQNRQSAANWPEQLLPNFLFGGDGVSLTAAPPSLAGCSSSKRSWMRYQEQPHGFIPTISAKSTISER
jgi:hypothetical protein